MCLQDFAHAISCTPTSRDVHSPRDMCGTWKTDKSLPQEVWSPSKTWHYGDLIFQAKKKQTQKIVRLKFLGLQNTCTKDKSTFFFKHVLVLLMPASDSTETHAYFWKWRILPVIQLSSWNTEQVVLIFTLNNDIALIRPTLIWLFSSLRSPHENTPQGIT